jgi:uncharacterized integral membrane protein
MSLDMSVVYQGQFGSYSINDDDRKGVIIYRAALAFSAVSFATATALILIYPNLDLSVITPLFACFCLGLGVALATIHIYMVLLHRVLQGFWAIGVIASVAIALQSNQPLAATIYSQPITILGVGFTFAALTGIFFKEAFCFNRFETKFLSPLVPTLLLGHLFGVLPLQGEQVLLGIWAVLFLVFAIRKTVQEIPADIGDKSVFDYLEKQRAEVR